MGSSVRNWNEAGTPHLEAGIPIWGPFKIGGESCLRAQCPAKMVFLFKIRGTKKKKADILITESSIYIYKILADERKGTDLYKSLFYQENN